MFQQACVDKRVSTGSTRATQRVSTSATRQADAGRAGRQPVPRPGARVSVRCAT